MPAHPRVGQTFTQEYYPGHAEDRSTIKTLDAFVSTPVVTSSHALLAVEWTPLEPGVVEHKKHVAASGSSRSGPCGAGTTTRSWSRSGTADSHAR